MSPEPRRASRDLGVQLIVAYKWVKAVAEVLSAVALLVTAATGEIAAVRDAADRLAADVPGRWAALAGRALAALLSRRGLQLVEVGLALDGVVSAFEGWSLWRGYRWGPWLVVAATATPFPLEVVEILRSPRPGRVAIALVNVAVVAYLARRIVRARAGAAHLSRGAPG